MKKNYFFSFLKSFGYLCFKMSGTFLMCAILVTPPTVLGLAAGIFSVEIIDYFYPLTIGWGLLSILAVFFIAAFFLGKIYAKWLERQKWWQAIKKNAE